MRAERKLSKNDPELYTRARERSRLWIWSSPGPGRPGYISCTPGCNDALLTYCDSQGLPVRHALYHLAERSQQRLLAIGVKVMWLRPAGQIVIDGDFEELHASLYRSATGNIYVHIRSQGWFAGGFERRAPSRSAKSWRDRERER